MAVKRISALFFTLFLALMFTLGLSGCGKTGKLYLPSDKPQAISETRVH